MRVMEGGQVFERHFPFDLQSVASVKGKVLSWRLPGGGGGGRADSPGGGGETPPSDHENLQPTRRISDASPGPVPAVGAVRLIQGEGSAIYLVAEGRRRHIPDMETFRLLGFHLKNVHQVDSAEVLRTPAGPDFSKLSNDLIKGSQPPVFLLENGRRRWIRDMPTFQTMGLKLSDVQVIADEDLRLIPMGADISR